MDMDTRLGGVSPMNDAVGTKMLLTIPEVALRLGLGRSLTYQLVMQGQIPSLKLGRARRVPLVALEEFIAGRLQEANGDT
jgi:excisionase family DNA binding protein